MRIVFVVLALFGICFPASAQESESEVTNTNETVGTVAIPDWVRILPLPAMPDDRLSESRNGTFDLLVDRQTKWQPGGYAYFYRTAQMVTDRSGLEDVAQVWRGFDPTDSTLDFNFIRVIRDGEVMDRLEDAEITVIRQEEQLQSGIIDGNLTAFVLLDDVRVGDIIEVATSGVVEQALWPDHRFESWYTDYNVPVARNHWRLLWPTDDVVYISQHATDVEPTITVKGELTEYLIDQMDADPVLSEVGAPAWFDVNGRIDFSTMKSWSEVSAWALPHYEGKSALPDDFSKRLDDIASRWPKSSDRITEVLRLIQDEIRYLGVEIGPGSFVPREPALVLSRGYGDCKDKSQLLVSALRYLGIDAWPALTDTVNGPALVEHQPSIVAFNHVIVKAVADGHVYWLDPTGSHQGGRGPAISVPDYAYALPIAKGQTDLEAVDPPKSPERTRLTEESFTFPAEGDIAMRLEVVTEIRSFAADGLRYGLAITSQDSLAKVYLDFYEATYPGLTSVSPASFEDDLDANLIVLRQAYEMTREAFMEGGFDTGFPLKALSVRVQLTSSGQDDRLTPLQIPSDLNREHIFHIKAPGRSYSQEDSFNKEVPGVAFSRTITSEDDSLTLTFILTTTEREVSAEDAKQVLALSETIDEMTNLTHTLPVQAEKLSERLNVSVEDLAGIGDEMQAIVNGIDAGDRVQTLQAISKLLDEDDLEPHVVGMLLQLRADLLKRLNRNRAARAAYAEGIELFPKWPKSYFSLADLQTDLKDFAGAARILTRLAKDHPEDARRLRESYYISLDRQLLLADLKEERFLLAQGLINAGYKADNQTGAWDGMYTLVIEGLVEREDVEEARGLIEEINSPAVLVGLMVDRKYEALWPDLEEHAGKDLGKAIDRNFERIQQAFIEDPEDREVAIEYVRTLGAVGRFQEAVDVATPYVSDLAEIEAIGEKAFWFANLYSDVLMENGQSDESIAVMADLVSLGVDNHPSLVSMLINFAGQQAFAGHLEASLVTVDELMELPEDFTSDYGMMWVHQDKACTLHRLGRGDESLEVLALMSELKLENESSYMRALLCLNLLDRAEEFEIARLTDLDPTDFVLMSFLQTEGFPNAPAFIKELDRRLLEVQSRPAVQAALNKAGRALEIKGFSSFWASY